jgi:hypothetical protein
MFRTYQECDSDYKVTINLKHIVKVQWIDSWRNYGAVAVMTMSDGSYTITTQPQLLKHDLIIFNAENGYGGYLEE